jgi:hypothetical protein
MAFCMNIKWEEAGLSRTKSLNEWNKIVPLLGTFASHEECLIP